MGQTKRGYLPTLDGWRAIAILAVIADHGTGYMFQSRLPRLFEMTRMGANGVSLFFAISGFLICSRLIEEFQTMGHVSLSGFYIRRASRILPPALAYLAFVGVLGALGVINLTSREWWSCVFFFRNYLPPSLITKGWGGYTIHYWSLAVEEHFYLIWPALLALSGIKRARWWAAGLAVGVACWRSFDFRHQFFDHHIHGLLFASRTDVRLDGLLVGCLAALLLSDSYWRHLFLRVMKSWIWIACAIFYVAVQVYYRRHYYTLLESVLLAVIVATTVLRPGTFIGRFLELSWMRWIGRLSYSLYLWQQFFFVPGAKHPFNWLQVFPLNILLLFGAAALSYKFVERPMIRLGHKLAPPPTPGRQDIDPVPESMEPRVETAVVSG